jgi:hypothetical protein
MQLVEENAFTVCYFQSVYVNPIRSLRFLESIQPFFLSPIGKERIFAIPISSACAEDHVYITSTKTKAQTNLTAV